MDYPNQIAASYYNLGKSYFLYENTDLALQFADSSIQYLNKTKDVKGVAKSVLLKASIFLK